MLMCNRGYSIVHTLTDLGSCLSAHSAILFLEEKVEPELLKWIMRPGGYQAKNYLKAGTGMTIISLPPSSGAVTKTILLNSIVRICPDFFYRLTFPARVAGARD